MNTSEDVERAWATVVGSSRLILHHVEPPVHFLWECDSLDKPIPICFDDLWDVGEWASRLAEEVPDLPPELCDRLIVVLDQLRDLLNS